MEARPSDEEFSKIALGMMWDGVMRCFTLCCGLGVPSLYGEERWLKVEPVASRLDQQSRDLRRMVLRLAIRVPQLTAAVRSLREAWVLTRGSASKESGCSAEMAKTLDRELVDLQDTDAEDAVLHRLKILITADPKTRTIMPCAYNFVAYDDGETAPHYWYLRFICTRLRNTLHGLSRSSKTGPTPSGYHLGPEQARLIASLIMSWHTTSAEQLEHHMRQGVLLNIWGALADATVFRNRPADAVRSWVLRMMRIVRPSCGDPHDPPINVAVMDMSSALFAGGLREGIAAVDIKQDGSEELKAFQRWRGGQQGPQLLRSRTSDS